MSAPHLRLVGAGPIGPNASAGEDDRAFPRETLQRYEGLHGADSTTYRYALADGRVIVVTAPTSLCGSEFEGNVWELVDAAAWRAAHP